MSYPTYPYPEDSTQRRIINFALKEFREKGVRSVKMDDIAHSLQMSKRTLYQLFADKEQIIIAGIQLMKWKEQMMVTSMLENNYNILEIILCIIEQRINTQSNISPQYIRDLTRYPTVQTYLRQHRMETLEQAEAFLQQGIEQGMFRSDVNFGLVISSILTALEQMMQNEDMTQHPSLHEIFINIGIFHLRGCCTPLGIELIDKFLDYYRDHNL